MAKFDYKAINQAGKTIEGTIEASSIDAAGTILSNQDVIPVSVKAAASEKSGGASSSFIDKLLSPIKSEDVIMFTKQMRTMLRAGIPIMQIFDILQDQTKNTVLKAALKDMGNEVQEGRSLTFVFKKHPNIFSKLYCGLINAGEVSGTMIEILEKITSILEHEYKVKRDIKSALAYPKMVIGVLFGSFFFLLNFVIPKFIGVFEKAGLDLPFPTQVCLIMYNAMQQYWMIMIGAVVGGIFAAKYYFKTDNGALNRDRFLTFIPIIGPLFIKSAMSRFASILSLLLASGISVLESFNIISETLGNAAISHEFKGIGKQLEEGRGISEPLRNTKYFPPMVVNMITIGEESGSLEDMLNEVAKHYDEEVAYAVGGLAEAIGPVMIIVLTGVVGFFALAIFMPMWDLTKMVQ